MEISGILNAKKSKIHFIGIGGVSMSSLAKLLLNDGHIISGSDINESANVRELKKLGITVYGTQTGDNIKDYDLVVYTAAVKQDNPELCAAREKGILCIERCVLLGEMMKNYRFPVNVAGTHGKTTTTSMLADIFVEAGKKPTVSVGGNFSKINGNLLIGEKDYFICEACEYVESFLSFHPVVSLILNVEEDHLDYFRNLEHIKEAFFKFAGITSDVVIYNGDDKNCEFLKNIEGKKLYTFGLGETNDYYAKDLSLNENGMYSYNIYKNGECLGEISLSVPGLHNVKNSVAAYAAADICGVDFESIAAGLKDFGGAERRFEYKGDMNGAKIYDDYAHHPSEIKALLDTVSSISKNNLYVVFQPHTYTRTKELMPEFVKVLSGVKTLIITKVYAAREKDEYGVNAKTLADNIGDCLYMESFEEIEDYLRKNAKKGDIIITVGAGDVFKIGEALKS